MEGAAAEEAAPLSKVRAAPPVALVAKLASNAGPQLLERPGGDDTRSELLQARGEEVSGGGLVELGGGAGRQDLEVWQEAGGSGRVGGAGVGEGG